MTYQVMQNPAKHTCWDDPNWDGTMAAEGECKGCDEAAEHKCQFCGYGHVFTTHSDLAHLDNSDSRVPADNETLTAWHDSPHIYI